MSQELIENKVQGYISLFEHLRPADIERFDDIYVENAHFKDPFNDVRGTDEIRKIFKHMFKTLESPTFHISHHAINNQVAYISWLFTSQTRYGKPFLIDGLSRITFNDEGKVLEHIDYWDSSEQFLIKLPILSWIIKSIIKKMRA